MMSRRLHEEGEKFHGVNVSIKLYSRYHQRCPKGSYVSNILGFTCIPDCPIGTLPTKAEKGDYICIAQPTAMTKPAAPKPPEKKPEPELEPPPAQVFTKTTTIIPSIQFGIGSAYLHPENMAIIDAGLALWHESISFNATVGVVHNFDETRLGLSLQTRFLFPSLKLFSSSEPYLGFQAIVFNTYYRDAKPIPIWLYLAKLGVDWIFLSNENTRIALDTGLYIGASHQTIAFISGSREETREEFSLSGGIQVVLRFDVR